MRNDAQTIRHTVAKYGIPLVIILRRLSLLLQLDKQVTRGLLQENMQPHDIGWKSLILKNSILICVFAAKALHDALPIYLVWTWDPKRQCLHIIAREQRVGDFNNDCW